ncbi:MAG TPA: cation-translocating P-type ATPase [Syntrophomonadaceae bacterium]|nr:cation-translocating P-type ATPase [Syntrophomonadaceae bacterium]
MLRDSKGQRVLLAGALIIAGLLTLKLNYRMNITDTFFLSISDVLMLLATFVAGYPIAVNAIQAIRYKILGIDALVTLAVIGAIYITEYWEAAAVTFLFMFGAYLEARALEKTRSAIKSLLELAPDVARVIRNGEEVEISPDQVIKGELVIVKPGEKIPVDGNVIEGSAYVNQASITGESMPVTKENDDGVFSGTILESGYLKIQAEKVGDDTTFARILEMVEEAQDKKAKTQKFLERFAEYYTPGIVVMAVIIYIFTKDLPLTLTLLVIACPGALVIATPVSVVAAIGNGARNGILIKGGEIIEKIGTVKVIAFDKTGTLTEGKPKVTKVKSYGIEETELLYLTASAEMYSEHPLARAIIAEASLNSNITLTSPEESEIIAGQGLKAKIDEKIIIIGNRKLISENKLEMPTHIDEYIMNQEAEGQTAVIIADLDNVLGVISIADTIRKDAVELVKRLRKSGAQQIVMLTGDNQRAAAAIANKIGLDNYYAELLPEDKVRILEDLQAKYGTAAMVGDGVNDAPALASADLGIAVGGAGTDVAMETADMVLMSDEIIKLSYAIGLSRATVRNMKQNIYFAVSVVVILLIGVLAKVVFLSSGMLVHILSVLAVIVNAIRLLGYKEKQS